MKRNIKTCLLVLILVWSGGVPVFAGLGEADAKQVRHKLEEFEKGQLTLEECTEPGGEEWGEKLVNYYLANTNSVTVKMKLPISRCFAAGGDYLKALPLATDYVNVYSNDWRGWKIVGGANMFLGDFPKAISAFTNAVRCGHKWSYVAAIIAGIKGDRLDLVTPIIPDVLRFKDSAEIAQEEKADMVKALIAYSLKADRSDVFTNALSGPKIEIDKSQEDLRGLILNGCRKFKATELEKLYKE